MLAGVIGGAALVATVLVVFIFVGFGGEPIRTRAAVDEAFGGQGITLFEEVDFGATPGSELQVVLDPERDFTREPSFRVAIYGGADAAAQLAESEVVNQLKPRDTEILRAHNVVVIYQTDIPSAELLRVQAAIAQLR